MLSVNNMFISLDDILCIDYISGGELYNPKMEIRYKFSDQKVYVYLEDYDEYLRICTLINNTINERKESERR